MANQTIPAIQIKDSNVGIGTTTPGCTLSVVGSICSSDHIRASTICATSCFVGNFCGNATTATSVAWGNISGHRTLSRDNAGLQGNAGARSGFFETVSPTNYYSGADSWQHLIEARHSNDDNNYAMQLAGSFFDQALYLRKTNNSATTAWRRIVTNDTETTWGINTNGNAGTATTAGNSNCLGSAPQACYVMTCGDQTIAGVKTFTSDVLISKTAPFLCLNSPAAGSSTIVLTPNTGGSSVINSNSATLPLLLQTNTVSRMCIAATGAININCSLGVGVAPNATAGRIDASNDIVAFSSDRRLKENIQTLQCPLQSVKNLSGFSYNWNVTANQLAGYDMSQKYVGLYAQEVQSVLPQAVKLAPFDNDGNDNSISGCNYLTVQYEKLVPLLVEAIKEQQCQIEELKHSLSILSKK